MRGVAIVAYGETKIVLRSGRSASYDLAGEVMDQILGRTGIDKSEIHGVCVTETLSQTENSFWPQYVCEMLGCRRPGWKWWRWAGLRRSAPSPAPPPPSAPASAEPHC
jgi:hypothetical protein